MRFKSAEAACTSCRQMYPASDLDRYLWCPNCRMALRRRGMRWGWAVGTISCVGLAAYLWIRVQPSTRFWPVYLLLLALTFTLTSRIAIAVVQGYHRSRASDAPGEETEGEL